jgi:cell division protein FtsL
MKALTIISLLFTSVSCTNKTASAAHEREQRLIAIVKDMQKRQDRINAYIKKLQRQKTTAPKSQPVQRIAKR